MKYMKNCSFETKGFLTIGGVLPIVFKVMGSSLPVDWSVVGLFSAGVTLLWIGDIRLMFRRNDSEKMKVLQNEF